MIGFSDDELRTFVELTARAIDLAIPPASMPEVLRNAATLAAHAERVMRCELPADADTVPPSAP